MSSTPARIYRGTAVNGAVMVEEEGKRQRRLDLRLDLRNHSPTGFAWGYSGSGPAQLALAIAADLVGDERARVVYQDLKDRVIAPLAMGKPFVLHSAGIMNEIELSEGRK